MEIAVVMGQSCKVSVWLSVDVETCCARNNITAVSRQKKGWCLWSQSLNLIFFFPSCLSGSMKRCLQPRTCLMTKPEICTVNGWSIKPLWQNSLPTKNGLTKLRRWVKGLMVLHRCGCGEKTNWVEMSSFVLSVFSSVFESYMTTYRSYTARSSPTFHLPTSTFKPARKETSRNPTRWHKRLPYLVKNPRSWVSVVCLLCCTW